MDRSEFRYQAFFCEENVWHFANEYLKHDSEVVARENVATGDPNCFALFLINASRHVTLMNQRVFGEDGVGVWDYHVVFFDANKRLIFDFDTMLPFPSDAKTYIERTFPEAKFTSAELHQYIDFETAQIRLIPADAYVDQFSSDRSHMLDENNLPLETFPQWDAILPQKKQVDLKYYWDVNEEINASEILDVPGFCEKFFGH